MKLMPVLNYYLAVPIVSPFHKVDGLKCGIMQRGKINKVTKSVDSIGFVISM